MFTTVCHLLLSGCVFTSPPAQDSSSREGKVSTGFRRAYYIDASYWICPGFQNYLYPGIFYEEFSSTQKNNVTSSERDILLVKTLLPKDGNCVFGVGDNKRAPTRNSKLVPPVAWQCMSYWARRSSGHMVAEVPLGRCAEPSGTRDISNSQKKKQ